MEPQFIILLTITDLINRMQSDDTQLVCDQFWLDIRADGVTPEQRAQPFIHLTASGYLVVSVSEVVSVRLYWSATLDNETGNLRAEPCDQNPGIDVYGPAALYPSPGTGSECPLSAAFSAFVAQPEMGDRIRACIHRRVQSGGICPLQTLCGQAS